MKNKTTVDKQEIAKFSQQSAHWWDKHGPFKTLHDINPVRVDYIEKSIPLQGIRLLDVGCGGGILSEALAERGALVTGLDAEKACIDAAISHALSTNLSIEYIYGSIETLDAEPFDVIVCMEMLEHVSDPSLVISHCCRLLKPGGLLFLSTINRSLKGYLFAVVGAEYLLNLLPRQTHDYQKFIKPSELAAMVRDNELELLNIKGLGYNPFSRQATLQEDISVNYMMACSKPG